MVSEDEVETTEASVNDFCYRLCLELLMKYTSPENITFIIEASLRFR